MYLYLMVVEILTDIRIITCTLIYSSLLIFIVSIVVLMKQLKTLSVNISYYIGRQSKHPNPMVETRSEIVNIFYRTNIKSMLVPMRFSWWILLTWNMYTRYVTILMNGSRIGRYTFKFSGEVTAVRPWPQFTDLRNAFEQ